LCDNLDIVQNMFLGRERKRGLLLDEGSMEQLAARTLAGLSVRTVKSVRQQVSSLSGGQRQTVAIAKAVLWNSKLVILDEPTAALGVAQTAQVLELVRRLADNGLAVVIISHNMNDVFAVADRIAAMYLGQVAALVPATEVTHQQVVELITAGRSGNLGIADSNLDLIEAEVVGDLHELGEAGPAIGQPMPGPHQTDQVNIKKTGVDE
jgi:D-xylose transport system ATP-binding protein